MCEVSRRGSAESRVAGLERAVVAHVAARVTEPQNHPMGQEKQAARAGERRYPRIALTKGMLVAWQSSHQRGVARAATLGLGGLFLATPDPLPVGTLLKLLFDVPTGEVRARAMVKNIKAGEGMAVAFIDMDHSDRARLSQLLKTLVQ